MDRLKSFFRRVKTFLITLTLLSLAYSSVATAEDTINRDQLIEAFKASDLNRDNNLTRYELAQAYFHPDTRPELYTLQFFLLDHFDWFKTLASDSIPFEHLLNVAAYTAIPTTKLEEKPEMMWDQLIPEESILRSLFNNGLASIYPQAAFQRGSSNCEIISAISSLTRTPQGKRLVLSYFTAIDKNHVKVTFPGAQQDIMVDLNDLEDNYATTINEGLWLSVMEYAMAHYVSHFICIDQYNNTSHDRPERIFREDIFRKYERLSHLPGLDVLRLITPRKAYSLKIKEVSEEALLRLITLTARESLIVTAGISKDSESQSYPELSRHHQYSVLGYYPYQQRVLLRDPNGLYEPVDFDAKTPLDGHRDGVFSLTIQEFRLLFRDVRFALPTSWTDLND